MNDQMMCTIPQHHIQQEFCFTRRPYRKGRKLKAVKAYSVAQESKFLLVQFVPSTCSAEDLLNLFSLYGEIIEYNCLKDYPKEKFTNVYLLKFAQLHKARMAKCKLDNYVFFGNVLHVCYAPEHETVQETRAKLEERRRRISSLVRKYSFEISKEREKVANAARHSLKSSLTGSALKADTKQPEGETVLPHQNSSKDLPPSSTFVPLTVSAVTDLASPSYKVYQSASTNLLDGNLYPSFSGSFPTFPPPPLPSSLRSDYFFSDSCEKDWAGNKLYLKNLKSPRTNNSLWKNKIVEKVVKIYCPERPTLKLVPRQLKLSRKKLLLLKKTDVIVRATTASSSK